MRSTPGRSRADLTGSALPSKLPVVIIAAVISSILLDAAPAHAMHLSDGVLPGSWCVVWTLVALSFVGLAVRRFELRQARDARLMPFLAMVGAGVFAISCMPIPVPWLGTCSHPCGTGLAALLVGPLFTVLLTAVALLLQALFLAHGGLTTLGADIVSMGVAGGFAGYLSYRIARRAGVGEFAAAFLAGILADFATYATTALAIALGLAGAGVKSGGAGPVQSVGELFATVCLAFAPTQLPLGVLEGAVTAFAFVFVRRRRPAMLGELQVLLGARRQP
ncbi:MAG TPA: energy-coupling factor ABC transporter permease [Polyangiaceae bacterium]|nr:energy-coupling factor ABC transporter permease [Polyangiaceae bacterium]